MAYYSYKMYILKFHRDLPYHTMIAHSLSNAQELYEEEIAEEHRRIAAADIEKRIRKRLELQHAEQEDIQAKREREIKEKQEEEV